MESFIEKLFISSELLYPTKNNDFVALGKNGVKLYNKIKKSVDSKLEELDYSQIILPTVFNKEYYEKFIGDRKKINTLVKAIYDDNVDLILRPYSEFIYADFAARNLGENNKFAYFNRVFQWGLVFLDMQLPYLSFKFKELIKCEIFSLHNCYETAKESWYSLNKSLYEICIEDFKIYPIYGQKLGINTFPSSKETFDMEISLGLGSFQTILVSHIMMDNFFDENGFLELSDKVLCSACLSFKMILNIMIHHHDSYGFRYPYKLAPIVGIISCSNTIEHKGDGDRIKIFMNSKLFDMKQTIIKEGAIWGIQEITEEGRTTRWQLWRRENLEVVPIEVDSFDKAIHEADDYVKNYDKQLLEESKQKLLNSIVVIKEYNQYNKFEENIDNFKISNFFIPCCDNEICKSSVMNKVRKTPKLFYENLSGNCIECGKNVNTGIMFDA